MKQTQEALEMHPAIRTPRQAVGLDVAIGEMLEYFSNNEWFIKQYWPENEPRVKQIITDLMARVPKGGKVLDPGCGNGYISYLAGRVGYEVTGADSWNPPDRDELFRRAGASYFPTNLNALDPWPQVENNSFDAIVFGEVFEHLLNHPIGLLRQMHRILRPGGVLVLTTPNPSTLANAIRVLLDRHSLWGTDDFARNPKVEDGRIIDQGDIHYREYRSRELRSYMEAAGFRVDVGSFIYLGSPATDPGKRFVKAVLGPKLMRSRLFGVSNYVVAVKP